MTKSNWKSNGNFTKAYKRRNRKEMRSRMRERFDLKPGDLVNQSGGTSYHPLWRQKGYEKTGQIFQMKGYARRLDSVLMYRGVKWRIVDTNSKNIKGWAYAFVDISTHQEYYFQEAPSYLVNTFTRLGSVCELALDFLKMSQD